ncbi:hypothetical protein Hanom_Chr16g01470161 [Helianthus anomalus]
MMCCFGFACEVETLMSMRMIILWLIRYLWCFCAFNLMTMDWISIRECCYNCGLVLAWHFGCSQPRLLSLACISCELRAHTFMVVDLDGLVYPLWITSLFE